MTENEAIEELHRIRPWGGIIPQKRAEALDVAIKALEDVQQYRAIENELKEHYHANVDIPLLMQHFIETVFEGEKHEGFCLLTNEDREAWEEYKKIGTPEECGAAEEKQTAKKPDYEGDGYADGQLVYDTWICPCCNTRYEVDYDVYNFCPNCGQKLDWSDEE